MHANSCGNTGGRGGYGYTGASSGAGGSSTLTNAASGTTTGGYLFLTQIAGGGAGGYSGGGTAGAAGTGSSALTFSDPTSASLTGSARPLVGPAAAGRRMPPPVARPRVRSR